MAKPLVCGSSISLVFTRVVMLVSSIYSPARSLVSAARPASGREVRPAAVVYDFLADVNPLPRGARDLQSPGQYRLEKSAGPRCFAWANGPQGLKPLVFGPQGSLW